MNSTSWRLFQKTLHCHVCYKLKLLSNQMVPPWKCWFQHSRCFLILIIISSLDVEPTFWSYVLWILFSNWRIRVTWHEHSLMKWRAQLNKPKNIMVEFHILWLSSCYIEIDTRWEKRVSNKCKFHYRILFLGAFAKLRKATISFVMSVCLSVCPHRSTRLPLDGFWWNLML